MGKMVGRRRGFTVIEMLVAIAFFATFYIIIMEVWPLSARSVLQAKNALLASHVAEQEMEYAIYQGYNAVSNRSGTYQLTSTINGVVQSSAIRYRVTVTPNTSDTKDVQVRVDWSDPAALPSAPQVGRNIQLETLLEAYQ